MRAHTFTLLFAITTSLLVSSAQAALIASDDFNSYTAGQNLSGVNGGTGWTNAWAADSGDVTTQSGDIPGAGVSMQVTDDGSTDPIAKRLFASQTGSVYLGFQLKATDFASDEFFQIYLNNGLADNSKGGSVGMRNAAGNPAFARVGGSSNTTNLVGSAVDDGEVHQIVLKLSKTGLGHASNYDFAEVFVDLATENTGAPAANYGSQTGNSGVSALSSVAFRTHQLNLESDFVYIDNLRIATTYAEVLAIPEPSSILLISLGLGYVLILRRRK
ncbi:PEP-CTERM sorting domain-containing protein [Kiritimatiellota bacterium B12222]|nr:PEP-CTERM sorting domain-containing protein [Kiritimatiellota bacterium B12222]